MWLGLPRLRSPTPPAPWAAEPPSLGTPAPKTQRRPSWVETEPSSRSALPPFGLVPSGRRQGQGRPWSGLLPSPTEEESSLPWGGAPSTQGLHSGAGGGVGTWEPRVRCPIASKSADARLPFSFFFLLHLQQVEVPGPGTQPAPQLQQHQILHLLCHGNVPPPPTPLASPVLCWLPLLWPFLWNLLQRKENSFF